MATIQLQGVGKHYAIPAKDLKPGHIACWNFGYSSIVKAVELSKTGKTITITTVPRSNDAIRNGAKEYKRRFGANRLIAVEKDLYAEEYAERSYIDPRSREYIYDLGGRIDDNTGMIYISRKSHAYRQLSTSVRDSSIHTWSIPTETSLCLIFEGKHFTITDS